MNLKTRLRSFLIRELNKLPRRIKRRICFWIWKYSPRKKPLLSSWRLSLSRISRPVWLISATFRYSVISCSAERSWA